MIEKSVAIPISGGVGRWNSSGEIAPLALTNLDVNHLSGRCYRNRPTVQQRLLGVGMEILRILCLHDRFSRHYSHRQYHLSFALGV